MNQRHQARRLGMVMLACVTAGCTASAPAPSNGGVYRGDGFYEPWNWGPVYRELPIVVGPPPHPGRPIAPAPRSGN